MARGGRRSGFTLIEVLVALVIVGLTFGASFEALSDGFGNIVATQRARAAMLLADALSHRVGADIAIDAGDASGATADGFAWTVAVGRDPDMAAWPRGVLDAFQVRVTVGWTEGARPRKVELATLRLRPAAAASQ